MTEKFNESIKFVTNHYQKGAFQPIMRFAPLSFWQRRGAVAAAVVSGILVASACIYFLIPSSNTKEQKPSNDSEITIETTPTNAPELEVKKIEFTDAPIAKVVKAIEETYNVKIDGLDADSDIRLTLRYEGSAVELVETINELEGTKLTIAE